MEHPARRGRSVALLAVVLVLVVAGVGAFLVVRLHHGTRPTKQAARSLSHPTAPTTPATTLPSRYAAVSATSSSATYAPGTAAYSLLVGATTSDCWMSVTSSTGTTVVAQTFTPGATASVSLTGRATIVIGAPAAAELEIGGIPLVLPSGATSPFTITLLPS
jgi:cytoskeletal protein RodZ